VFDPFVKIYNVDFPDLYYPTILGLCWWRIPNEYAIYVMYNDQLVCHWGGKKVVQQLPYERRPGLADDDGS
jgi:hypothetical protein